MARIQEYNSTVVPETTINPEKANGASYGPGLETLGAGLEQVGSSIDAIQARQQVTKNNVLVSKAALDLETQIANQKTSFDPTEPDAQEKYMAGFKQATDGILQNTSNPKAQEYTQELVDHHVANYWNMALHKNAQLQGQELGDMVSQKLDTDSQSVYQQPGMLGQKKQEWDQFIANLPAGEGVGAHAEKVKFDAMQSLTKAAAKGAIQRDPEGALEDFKAGKYDLPGNDINQLQNMATSEIRAQKNQTYYDQNRAINVQNQFQRQNHQEMLKGIDSGQIDFPKIQDAANRGFISPEQQTIQEGRLTRLVDGTFKDDAGVLRDAERRLRLPDGDPNKITDFQTLTSEYGGQNGKGIGQASLQRLSKMYLAPPGTPNDDAEMLKKLSDTAAQKLIQPSAIPWGDRQGMASWAKAMNDMHSQYEKNKQAGMSSNEMFDPSSKNYLGKTIDSYQRSRSEMTAQATYNLHGPGAFDPNVGTLPVQPVGIDPSKTPLPTNQKPATLTPKEQAALDSLKDLLPPAKAGK